MSCRCPWQERIRGPWPLLSFMARGRSTARPSLLHGGAHRCWLIERSSSVVRPLGDWWWNSVPLRDICRDGLDAGCAVEPQGPAERPPPLRQREAVTVRVQVSTTTRQPAPRVGDEFALDRDDA